MEMITGKVEEPLFESVDALKEFLAAQLKVYRPAPWVNNRLETPDGIDLQMKDPRNVNGLPEGHRLIFWFRYITLGDIHLESMMVETATGKAKPRIREPLTDEQKQNINDFVHKEFANQ
jgi:hypothetical protein